MGSVRVMRAVECRGRGGGGVLKGEECEAEGQVLVGGVGTLFVIKKEM